MAQTENKPLISIVICTFNRADLLRGTLLSFSIQEFDPNAYELIVVDNNSNDHTFEVVQSFMPSVPCLRYVFEKRQGISFARNLGMKEARGKYVGFTDDDCRITPNWLFVAKQIIEEKQPAIFGGPANVIYGDAKPDWFKDIYINKTIADSAQFLPRDSHVAGYNMFFRKSILDALGGFSGEYGMNGKRIAYGEDTAIQMKLRTTFPHEKIYFDPNLRVDHLIREDKMTLSWLARSFFAKGRYVYLITYNGQPVSTGKTRLILQALRTVAAFAWDSTFGMMKRNRNRFPFPQNYLCERSSRYIRGLGRIYGQLQTMQEIPQRDASA